MEGSSSAPYVSGSTPTPPPAQKQKKPTLGDKILSLFKPAEKKEASAPIKTVVKLQSSGLTLEDENLLKEKVGFQPSEYKNKDRQKWALSTACDKADITDEPLRLKLLEILLLKLEIDPKTKGIGRNFAFEKLFSISAHQINEPALTVFFKAGLSYGDLSLDLIAMCNNIYLFKQALDAGANPNQPGSSGLKLSPLFPEGSNSGKAQVLHGLSWDSYKEYLTYLLKTPNLNINATDTEGRTALMSVINHPEQCESSIPLLLKAGIDQTICDIYGRTGLFYLLMSAEEPSVFENTLATLMEHRLDLNAPLKKAPFNGSSQFAYCLKLLADFDMAHRQVDIWNKPHITANLVNMIEQGADLGKVPLLTYIKLPVDVQKTLQEAQPRDISIESATTSSEGTPPRLSESPGTTPVKPPRSLVRTPRSSEQASEWIEMFWFNLPEDLCKKVDANFADPASQKVSAFKTSIANALHKAVLDIVFSTSEEDLTATSLKEALVAYLQPMAGRHQANPALFENALAGKLNEWKTKQRAAELEKADKKHEVQEQQNLLQEAVASIKADKATVQEAAKKAEAAAAEASADANDAETSRSMAGYNATSAAYSASSAHHSAMHTMFKH